MKVGIPGLGLAVAEPMAVDAISFQQGGREGLPSPVTIRSTFTNVVVEGLSTFRTDYIDADPDTHESGGAAAASGTLASGSNDLPT